jgi:lysophospholipase L1-like esterase
MNMNTITSLILAALLLAMLAALHAAAAQNGPTPYPSPTKDKDWQGKGVIREFPWMGNIRKKYWAQRENDQGAIVFAGDSLTENWPEISRAFPNLKVVSRGIGGDVSRGLLFRFQEDVVDLNPRAVVINIGTNDLTALGKTDDTISNISAMIAMVERKNPDTPIILCTVPPSESPKAPIKLQEKQALNAKIAKLAAGKKNIALCDLFAAMANADGTPKPEFFTEERLHLAGAGYDRWAETIKPLFKQMGVK